jgi:glycosidase
VHRFATLALSLLIVACGDSAAEPNVDPRDPPELPPGNHTFSYSPPAGAPQIGSIAVRGSFNDWNSAAMQRREDGSWIRPAQLPEGATQYKFFVNGTWVDDMCYDTTWGDPANGWIVDPEAAACVSDGFSGRNAVALVGDVELEFRHSPANPADLSEAGGRLSVRFRARLGQVEAARLVTGSTSTPMHLQFRTGLDERWRGTAAPGAGSYTVEVDTPTGTLSFGPYTVPGTVFRAVQWVGRSVGYQIFPERFWNGDPSNDDAALATDEYAFQHASQKGTPPVVMDDWNGPVGQSHCCHQYFGGDLQGIIDRLDDLQARGADVLYLNPVFESGSAHGYDTFDYMKVAENFGDSTVLRTLLDQAHARDMRIIWDYVPNHVGIGHWAFQDAVAKGESSDYWDWFNFRVPADQVQAGNGTHYDAWWGFGSLPELQTEVPEVMDHLLEVAVAWTEFGFDGIRVDVPGDIDNRPVFFPAWREAVKTVDPDVYLVGEIWEQDATWLRGNQFDALMNYAMGQGVVLPYARGESGGPTAAAAMVEQYDLYPEAVAAMNFNLISSHDTDRLLTMLDGGELGGTPSSESLARHRLAVAVLYALPGMPVTYQGDECGFLGGSAGNHTARYPIQWERCDPDLVSWYAELAELRRGSAALTSPVFRTVEGSGSLLAFLRGEPGEGEVLAAFNNASAPATMPLPAGSWTDLGSDAVYSDEVTVDGLGWLWLERR